MNLSGTICYLQESFFLKTSKNFSLNFNQLYFSLSIKFKDLYNSNDFSQFSVIFHNFIQIYRLKENGTVDKHIFLMSTENCIHLEDDFLKTSFHKKLKNFSYWCSKEWILEKESFKGFYFFTFFIFLLLQVSPGNYYVDGYLSSKLCKEKAETWVILLTIDVFYLLDNFKEIYWNLISNSLLRIKKLNKDILFNFLSKTEPFFNHAQWKFFSDILINTAISKGSLILTFTNLLRLKHIKTESQNINIKGKIFS